VDPRSPIAILTFAVDAPDGCSEFLLVVSSRHFIRNRSRVRVARRAEDFALSVPRFSRGTRRRAKLEPWRQEVRRKKARVFDLICQNRRVWWEC